MGKVVRIVCLANSRKGGDRCIAGMEFGSTEWVRPISRRSSEAVSATERQYANGTEPRVLDVVSMRLAEERSDGFQRENWLLDSAVQWERRGRIDWEELCLLEQQPESLWINGFSSWGGFNNKIPVGRQGEISNSLALIRVDAVEISGDFARFHYMGSDYAINLTDPVYEERMMTKGSSRQRLGESFITVSLGKEWYGFFYKFAAAIIERTEIESGER
ncbi:dual OB domain-containing protein [Streptomyces malaysiensis]